MKITTSQIREKFGIPHEEEIDIWEDDGTDIYTEKGGVKYPIYLSGGNGNFPEGGVVYPTKLEGCSLEEAEKNADTSR